MFGSITSLTKFGRSSLSSMILSISSTAPNLVFDLDLTGDLLGDGLSPAALLALKALLGVLDNSI